MCCKRFARERGGQALGVRLIRVFLKDTSEPSRIDGAQECGSGLSVRRIHPHIQRPGVFHGKAAGGIINLHGGNTESARMRSAPGNPACARIRGSPAKLLRWAVNFSGP